MAHDEAYVNVLLVLEVLQLAIHVLQQYTKRA